MFPDFQIIAFLANFVENFLKSRDAFERENNPYPNNTYAAQI